MNILDPILLNAPSPIACIDEQMNFINANKKFLQALNLSNESSIKGRPFSDFFESIENLSLVERFINSDELHLAYNQNILIDRKLQHFRFTVEKIYTPKLIIVVYADNQTEFLLKSQELEALKVSTIMASRMAVLGEMTGGIAHEINNPLTVIVGLTDQAIRELNSPVPDIPQTIKKLSKIKLTANRIYKIIQGLKAHSRDGASDPFQANLVKDLVNDSLALCVDTLRTHEIKLIVDEIDPLIELDCRGTQISQVILNLISNAKDAIKNKIENRWIQISARDTGNCIEFSLTDSGNGIAPELREKILHPFFTTKPAGQGTGLGLSITKNIIDSHFGKLIIAENTKNTTFIFSIPKGLSSGARAGII